MRDKVILVTGLTILFAVVMIVAKQYMGFENTLLFGVSFVIANVISIADQIHASNKKP